MAPRVAPSRFTGRQLSSRPISAAIAWAIAFGVATGIPASSLRMEQRRRLLQAIGVATLLVALLGIVALAAGGRAPLGGNRGEGRSVPIVFWDYVFSTAVVLFVLAVPFLVWVFWGVPWPTRRRSGRRADVLVLVYVALVCAAVVGASRVWGEEAESLRLRIPRVETRGRPPLQDDERRTPEFRWLPLVIVAGGAVAFVAYQRTRARRAPSLDRRSEEELVDELTALLDDTLDDLRDEPDPRRAVIAAYARMERVLAAFGAPRRPFEAPLEYVQRVAPDLEHVPAASRLLSELTHLYERAKFSPHTIGPEMKEHAIATLQSLRGELLAPA